MCIFEFKKNHLLRVICITFSMSLFAADVAGGDDLVPRPVPLPPRAVMSRYCLPEIPIPCVFVGYAFDDLFIEQRLRFFKNEASIVLGEWLDTLSHGQSTFMINVKSGMAYTLQQSKAQIMASIMELNFDHIKKRGVLSDNFEELLISELIFKVEKLIERYLGSFNPFDQILAPYVHVGGPCHPYDYTSGAFVHAIENVLSKNWVEKDGSDGVEELGLVDLVGFLESFGASDISA
jgi:hypothetical protein